MIYGAEFREQHYGAAVVFVSWKLAVTASKIFSHAGHWKTRATVDCRLHGCGNRGDQ